MMQTVSMERSGYLTLAGQLRGWGQVPVMVATGVSLVFLVGFVNSTNLLVEKTEVGLDAQVLVKLGVSFLFGGYGLMGFLTDARVRDWMSSFPALGMVAISILYFLAVPSALLPASALASAIVLCWILLGTVTAMVQLGKVNLLNVVFYSLAVFNLGSWVCFLWIPEIGVFMEPLADGEFKRRMSGLSHANTLGQFSGFTVILGTVLYLEYGYRSWFRRLIIMSAIVTLCLSFSRTSIAATIGALLVGYRHLYLQRRFSGVYFFGGLLVIMGLIGLVGGSDLQTLIESRIPFLTKSGQASELMTATGRTEIWAYSLELIGQQPWLGYGAASSKMLLAEYSSYTHNLVLNVALSTGVLGGLACIMMFIARIRGALLKPSVMADSIVAMIVLNGIFENVMFSIIASTPTLLWIVALLWWNDRRPASCQKGVIL